MSASEYLSLRTLMEVRADLYSDPEKVERRYPWLMEQIRATADVINDHDYLRQLQRELRIRSLENRISKLEDDVQVDPHPDLDR